MNLKYMKVSLFEISYKKKWTFHHILIFWDVPVCSHLFSYHLVMRHWQLGLRVGLKGIVHFEIKIWYLSAYPKGIQDVGVFFSSVDPILMFLGQTVLVCQSYNGRYRCPSL